MSFWRALLAPQGVVPAEALRHLPVNRQVRVAGVVLVRQRPSTARGITFVTLEDETGVANLIVRPEIWQRYREVAKRASAWLAQGRLERQGEVIHVLVNRLQDLAPVTQRLTSRSRDFR